MINEERSYTEYNVKVPTTDFPIGFDILDDGIDVVAVTLNDVDPATLGYTVIQVNNTTYRFAPAVPSGVVRLTRITDIDQMAHVFTEGAIFISENMDGNFKQIRHAQQEVRDNFGVLQRDFSGLEDTVLPLVAGLAVALQAAESAASAAGDAADIAVAVQTDIAQKFPNGKLKAVDVLNASTETQQQINDFGGAKWYAKVGGYKLGATVKLDNGDIVKSTIPNNTANPNVDMTGWVKPNDASQIFDKNGLSQQLINNMTLTPFHFGAIGDGVYHKLSERYATIEDARVKYPTAQSLDDSIDLCALEAFFDHCHDNLVNANITINAYVNRPLYVGMIRTDAEFKTTVFNGDFILINTSSSHEIPFLSRINVRAATFTGKLTFIGDGSGNVKDRKQLGGLVIGDNGTDGSAGRVHINSVSCNGFKNFGTFLSNDSIFPRIDNMHCGAIGSIGQAYVDSGTAHAATITARTDVDGEFDQHSLLTVTSLPTAKDNDLNILGSMVRFEGDPLPYRVVSVDAANNQIKVYPRLSKDQTHSKLSYIYGTGLGWSGNNSGAGNFGHLQFILCGIGFWGGSLYGANIDYLSTEFCGVGLTLGSEWAVVIGYNIDNAYFEANTWDYIQQWSNTHSPLVNINMAHGLNIDRVAELYSYRVTPWNDERPQDAFNRSSITLGHRKYEIKGTYVESVDLSDPCDFINVLSAGGDLLLNHSNRAINDKFKMRAKTLVIAKNYPWVTPSPITIKVPSGWYLNGVLNGTLTTNPQKFATVLTVVRDATDNYNNQSLYVYGESLYKTIGTTPERPSNAPTGFVYIDTTLVVAGKPIYKAASGWVDSAGVPV